MNCKLADATIATADIGVLEGATPLVFEGATADAHELTIAVPPNANDYRYIIISVAIIIG